jgi:FkbM family methyltransferase
MNIIYYDQRPRLHVAQELSEGEDKLARLMQEKFGVKTIFSVGAQKDFDFCKIFKDQDVHLFEPNKFAFKELINNDDLINNPNIHLNFFGINDKEGYFTYYYNGESIYNHDGKDQKDVIFLTTLKKYMDSRNISNIDFIKIDVEGLEYEVIKSSEDYLDKIEFIQFEYGERYPLAGKTLGNMYDLLQGRYIYNVEKDVLRYAEYPVEHFHHSNYLASKIKL